MGLVWPSNFFWVAKLGGERGGCYVRLVRKGGEGGRVKA